MTVELILKLQSGLKCSDVRWLSAAIVHLLKFQQRTVIKFLTKKVKTPKWLY